MATYVAGQSITLWVPLVDHEDNPITTAVDVDFAESIDHEAADGTLTTVDVATWQHRSHGRYFSIITDAQEGKYSGLIFYQGTPPQTFEWSAEVISAVQRDPLQASVSAYAAGTAGMALQTAASEAAALSTRLTTSRAALLDRIGTAGATLSAPSSPASSVISIRRGDDYGTGSPHGPFEWSESAWEAYDLPSGVITWRMLSTDAVVLARTCTLPDGATIRLELTDTETSQLRFGVFPFEVVAVIGSDTVTLVTGTAVVP